MENTTLNTSLMVIVFFYRLTTLYKIQIIYSVDSHLSFLIQLLLYIYSRVMFLVKYFYLYFNFNIISALVI